MKDIFFRYVLLLAVITLGLVLFLIAQSFPADAPDFKAQLDQITAQREQLSKDYQIGQLMQQNAVLRSQMLDQQEKEIKAKMEEQSKTKSESKEKAR